MKNTCHLYSEAPKGESLSLEIWLVDSFQETNVEDCLQKHIQSNYEIIWIQKGSGIHTINQTEYQLMDSMVYCVLPGQKHQLLINPGATGYIISFTESFLNRHYNEYSTLLEENFFHHLLQHPELVINSDVAEDMQDVISLLLKETKNNYALRTELVIKYLRIFLIYLRRQLETKSVINSMPKTNALIKHFQWLLERQFKEKKTVSQYAKDLFITPNHLNRVLKTFTGLSARQLIKQRIILEAKKKAQQPGSSMKEIAYELGFTDMAHFSRYFKKTSGLNFSSFKKETTHKSINVS